LKVAATCGHGRVVGRVPQAGCDVGMDKRAEFGLAQLRVLGQRLRTLRRTRNLSLRRLANDSGVSVAAIHDLEAGNSSPSLLNVLSIAEVLGEPVDRLIAASMQPDNAVRLVQGALPGRSGKRNTSLGELSAPRMRSAILSIASKSKLQGADRPTAVPMFAYVLDGTVDLIFGGGRNERLAASDAIHIATEPPAAWSNPFARRAIILCVVALAAAVDVPGVFDA
jgi:transcriptional regulator with XRE-family HTH domain